MKPKAGEEPGNKPRSTDRHRHKSETDVTTSNTLKNTKLH